MSKSYKKAVTIGIAAFSAVALLSTGAAAFVLTNEAMAESDGSISVGTITDNGVQITLDGGSESFAFNFDAPTTDTSGRIQYGSEEGSNGESLSATISGTVSPTEDANIIQGDVNDKYTVTYTLAITAGTDTEGNFAKYVTTNLESATEKEYLVLDSSIIFGGEKNTVTVAEDGKFSITISFDWGDYFGKMNPSLYYDADGASTSLSDAKSELNNLTKLENVKFDLTINAAAK